MLNSIKKRAVPQKTFSDMRYFNILAPTYYLKLATFATSINLRYPKYNNIKIKTS